MGTSNSYGGPGGSTPLVPSWLENDLPPFTDSPDENSEEDNNNGGDEKVDLPTSVGDETPSSVSSSSDRFKGSRSNFTRFAKSGGRDSRSLARSLSTYVSKSSGGPRKAAQRMGSSRKAAIGLIDFLGSVRTLGSQVVLESLNFTNLIGRSIEEIFVGLTDYICPDGGTVDEGIARSAFIETIADLAEQGIANLDNLTSSQLQTIIEIFATHAIEARICNDIGTKICFAPSNIQMVEEAQDQLHDYIRRSVSDALSHHDGDLKNLTSSETIKFVDQVYEETFMILQTLNQKEDNSE